MKIFGLEINLFKNNVFKFNNVNYIIRDLHEENKRLQQYLDSSKPRFESIKFQLKTNNLLDDTLISFFEMKEKDFKYIEDRIERNKDFILKLQQSDKS